MTSLEENKNADSADYPEPNTYAPHTLSSVRMFSYKYPSFPEGGLRHMIFHAESNGFAKAFLRIGRKVLIDEEVFFQCIADQNKPLKHSDV